MDNLNPNIKKTVLWLNENNFITTDSGDGTNFKEGMECAIEGCNVFMGTDGHFALDL